MDKYKIDFSSYKKKFSYCKTNTKCSVDNCNNPIFCKGYCTKYYAQIQHYGKIINTIYMIKMKLLNMMIMLKSLLEINKVLLKEKRL